MAELLRLYLQHDMIEDATELSIDLLESITSASCEQFGQEVGDDIQINSCLVNYSLSSIIIIISISQTVLSATLPPQSVWLPYTTIDILLNLLGEHRNDDYYRKVCSVGLILQCHVVIS